MGVALDAHALEGLQHVDEIDLLNGLQRPYLRLCMYSALIEAGAGYFPEPALYSGVWVEVVGAKATSRHQFGVVAAIAQVSFAFSLSLCSESVTHRYTLRRRRCRRRSGCRA